MKLRSLSAKQRRIYDFILSEDYALVCDGAVRSGKTTHMAAAFLIWAMEFFDGKSFAICGKTIQSAERNVVRPLTQGGLLPYDLQWAVTNHCLTVRCGARENRFYVFGGRDEQSYMFIQGITLSGVLLDEAALMPESFVNQAMARCAACENAKFWFNCNPEGPDHWFYKRWIEKPRRGVTHLHFRLEDNPALTKAMIRRTKALYAGAFYDRYILGKWVRAEGLVYPMFGKDCLAQPPGDCTRWVVSMDYGIQNPTAMLLWGFSGGVWYLTAEYYHAGRETGEQKTDGEYYAALEALAGDRPVDQLIIDPSAASFIALARRQGRFRVRKAVNEVLPGIQRVAAALTDGKIKISPACVRTNGEFGQYVWDSGQDRPVKEHDHAMDAVRYFVSTMKLEQKRSAYRPLWN